MLSSFTAIWAEDLILIVRVRRDVLDAPADSRRKERTAAKGAAIVQLNHREQLNDLLVCEALREVIELPQIIQ